MIFDEKFLWVEKYRPHKVAECILPEDQKVVFQRYVDEGTIPNLILTGSAGTGKTTVAKAMCDEIGTDYIMINGSDESGIDTLRVKIKGFASSVSFSGKRKVVIVDEADYLTPQAQAAFRGVIEEFADNCSFIFTCNFVNRLIEPLHSRSAVINFRLNKEVKQKMAAAFFNRVKAILKAENVEFDEKVVVKVITKYFPDYRRVLGELQRYSKIGKIDEGILAQVSDVKINTLLDAMKKKDFAEVRKWSATNADVDVAQFFRELYEKMFEVLKQESIPQAVFTIGEWQYKSAFSADKEIAMMACFVELMLNVEFK